MENVRRRWPGVPLGIRLQFIARNRLHLTGKFDCENSNLSNGP